MSFHPRMEVLRVTRILFDDDSLLEIAEFGWVADEYMDAVQVREFYRLYEKEILGWLCYESAKTLFDKWINTLPPDEAMDAIGRWALAAYASVIVDNMCLGYQGPRRDSCLYNHVMR